MVTLLDKIQLHADSFDLKKNGLDKIAGGFSPRVLRKRLVDNFRRGYPQAAAPAQAAAAPKAPINGASNFNHNFQPTNSVPKQLSIVQPQAAAPAAVPPKAAINGASNFNHNPQPTNFVPSQLSIVQPREAAAAQAAAREAVAVPVVPAAQAAAREAAAVPAVPAATRTMRNISNEEMKAISQKRADNLKRIKLMTPQRGVVERATNWLRDAFSRKPKNVLPAGNGNAARMTSDARQQPVIQQAQVSNAEAAAVPVSKVEATPQSNRSSAFVEQDFKPRAKVLTEPPPSNRSSAFVAQDFKPTVREAEKADISKNPNFRAYEWGSNAVTPKPAGWRAQDFKGEVKRPTPAAPVEKTVNKVDESVAATPIVTEAPVAPVRKAVKNGDPKATVEPSGTSNYYTELQNRRGLARSQAKQEEKALFEQLKNTPAAPVEKTVNKVDESVAATPIYARTPALKDAPQMQNPTAPLQEANPMYKRTSPTEQPQTSETIQKQPFWKSLFGKTKETTNTPVATQTSNTAARKQVDRTIGDANAPLTSPNQIKSYANGESKTLKVPPKQKVNPEVAATPTVKETKDTKKPIVVPKNEVKQVVNKQVDRTIGDANAPLTSPGQIESYAKGESKTLKVPTKQKVPPKQKVNPEVAATPTVKETKATKKPIVAPKNKVKPAPEVTDAEMKALTQKRIDATNKASAQSDEDLARLIEARKTNSETAQAIASANKTPVAAAPKKPMSEHQKGLLTGLGIGGSAMAAGGLSWGGYQLGKNK